MARGRSIHGIPLDGRGTGVNHQGLTLEAPAGWFDISRERCFGG